MKHNKDGISKINWTFAFPIISGEPVEKPDRLIGRKEDKEHKHAQKQPPLVSVVKIIRL